MSKSSSIEFSTIKVFALAVLRIAIGWHFLFEGISKLFTPTWTSADFLLLSNWIFAGFFHWIAGNSALLGIADGVVTWTLIVIGLSLILGLLDRAASVAGMALIALFWLANPPLTGLDFGVPHEGNYLIVDKNLVEFFALLVLCLFPTGRYFGIDHFFYRKNATITPIEKEEKRESGKKEPEPDLSKMLDRRVLLRGLSTLPVLGVFGLALRKQKQWESYEEKNLVDAVTGASAKTFNMSSLKELKEQFPWQKSRMFPSAGSYLAETSFRMGPFTRPDLCFPAG